MVRVHGQGYIAGLRIGQDLDHNRITLRSYQLCLGFHTLVKVLHHHDHMRAGECLLGHTFSSASFYQSSAMGKDMFVIEGRLDPIWKTT